MKGGGDKERREIKMADKKVKKDRNLLWTAVGEDKKGEKMGRRVEGATTSHPLSDLWVAEMTDGEALKLKVIAEALPFRLPLSQGKG